METPVLKVISIINSCITEEHFFSAERMVSNYVKMVRRDGVDNSVFIHKYLYNQISIAKSKLYNKNYRNPV